MHLSPLGEELKLKTTGSPLIAARYPLSDIELRNLDSFEYTFSAHWSLRVVKRAAASMKRSAGRRHFSGDLVWLAPRPSAHAMHYVESKRPRENDVDSLKRNDVVVRAEPWILDPTSRRLLTVDNL